jgi:outer membrane protein TolC
MKFKYYIVFAFCLTSTAMKAQTSLPQFIEAAKTNSPLINENKNLIIANQAEAERIRAIYNKAQVGLSANYLFAPIYTTDNGKDRVVLNSDGADHYYGYDLGATNGGAYQGLLTITQPLFNSKRTELLADQALVSARMNQNNIRLTGHELEKTVTDQYILCLLDKRQADHQQEILQLLDQQRFIVKKLVNSSLLKSSDLTLLNIEYENNLGILTTYKADYHRDLMDLKILSGVKDSATVVLDSVSLSLKVNNSSSDYIEKYRLDSLNLVASQEAFETKYKPQLNVFANTGLNAVYLSTIGNRFGLSAGLSLTWSLLDGQQKQITRRKTNALLQSVSFYKDNFQNQNNVRKAKILTELQSYDSRMQHAQKQLTEYQSLINGYRKQIIQAQLSVIDFINVLKNRSAVQREYFLLESNRLLLINAYNYWNW